MMSQIKVLMVDDEKRFRDTTKKILNKKGFETIVAESGEDALEKIDQNPDVVILDIKMPGMDGHETLEKNKGNKTGAAGDHAHRPRCHALGKGSPGPGCL